MVSSSREIVERSRLRWGWLGGLIWIGAVVVCGVAGQAQPASTEGPSTERQQSEQSLEQQLAFFEQSVRPLLIDRCVNCHGPNKQESGLRVDTRGAIFAGGDSGPAIDLQNGPQSLLLRAVRHEGDIQMPPEQKLEPDAIRALEQWVAWGAPWPGSSEAATRDAAASEQGADDPRQFWAFQPIRDVEIPALTAGDPPAQQPVDLFILAGLREQGLEPAPRAELRVLLRRMTFDLTGLPPTPEQFARWLPAGVNRDTDASAEYDSAVERCLDELLNSRAYGERWGRHWLDVVRYADTAGETADYPVREAYRYRNWVIRAIAADLPYDEFLRVQIAGDLYAQEKSDAEYEGLITATGFLAISRRFGFDSENYHYLTIQDTIDTVGQAVLGLSLGCARCHHHKYDPVTMNDYYALYGIFASTRYAFPGSEEKKRPYDFVPAVAPAEAQRRREAYDGEMAAIDQRLAAWQKRIETLTNGDGSAPSSADVTSSPEGAADEPRTREELQRAVERLQAQRARLVMAGPYPVVYAVAEGTPQDAPLQKRGDPKRPGELVPRRFLEILGANTLQAPDRESGRRDLAQWLTDPANPLTARVIVNRVWKWHFGEGLVRTPNDFGRRGQAPTHPELLDYLAHEFMTTDGWSLKQLHRRLMLSRTYQQSSLGPEATMQRDPDNRWWGRFNRRRLDAESFRDAMLAVAGKLNPDMGGEHPFPPVETWNFTQHSPFRGEYPSDQRSVYLMVQRQHHHSFLALFDGADPNVSTGQRVATTVPTQSLYLLNSPWVHQQADAFAHRVCAISAIEDERLDAATQLVWGRAPTDEERNMFRQFLADYPNSTAVDGAVSAQPTTGWAALARILFESNEFQNTD